jgi:3-deoxy-D-manno-octulosonic acid kinase
LSAAGIPAGYVLERTGRATLVAEAARAAALVRAGLADPAGWEARLPARGRPGSGRGGSVALELAGVGPVRLKALRRGGLARRLWSERHAGRGRLLANLALPLEARARGIPTPAPVALLTVEGPPGLHRGWLAVEEIPGAVDLATRFAAGPPPEREELAVVIALVRRMHDRGLEHRDLNLGNLLLRQAPGGASEGFVIDLDRARLRSAPLGAGRRRRGLRRLERSCLKSSQQQAADPRTRRLLYDLYAAGDLLLAGRLARGRRRADLLLFLHGLGWRRPR